MHGECHGYTLRMHKDYLATVIVMKIDEMCELPLGWIGNHMFNQKTEIRGLVSEPKRDYSCVIPATLYILGP